MGLVCFGPICFETGLAIGDDDPAIITMYGVENTSYISHSILQCLPNLEHVITLQARIHALFLACWEEEKGQKGKRGKEREKENGEKRRGIVRVHIGSVL